MTALSIFVEMILSTVFSSVNGGYTYKNVGNTSSWPFFMFQTLLQYLLHNVSKIAQPQRQKVKDRF